MAYTILNSEGRWAEAEPYIRKVIDEIARTGDEKKHPDWVPSQRGQLARNLMRRGRLVEAEIEVRKALLKLLGTVGKHSETTTRTLERIWRWEGLKVPQKQPKRGRLWLNDGFQVIENVAG